MKFLLPLVHFVFHFGYAGLLVLGILDSSFLVFPFGNDLMVAGMVARRHRGAPWYVLSAAVGSTLGVVLLALVSRKLGEHRLRRIAGEKRFEMLKSRIGDRGAIAVAIAALSPAPFPTTLVIAAVSAIDYPIWRTMVINFIARSVRFTAIAVLAIVFGSTILEVAKSPSFEWGMTVFISLCAIATGLSIWHWLRRPREANG